MWRLQRPVGKNRIVRRGRLHRPIGLYPLALFQRCMGFCWRGDAIAPYDVIHTDTASRRAWHSASILPDSSPLNALC
jgi:hypothetical protein